MHVNRTPKSRGHPAYLMSGRQGQLALPHQQAENVLKCFREGRLSPFVRNERTPSVVVWIPVLKNSPCRNRRRVSRILLGVWDGRYRSVTGRGVLEATVKDPRIRCIEGGRKREETSLRCPVQRIQRVGSEGPVSRADVSANGHSWSEMPMMFDE